MIFCSENLLSQDGILQYYTLSCFLGWLFYGIEFFSYQRHFSKVFFYSDLRKEYNNWWPDKKTKRLLLMFPSWRLCVCSRLSPFFFPILAPLVQHLLSVQSSSVPQAFRPFICSSASLRFSFRSLNRLVFQLFFSLSLQSIPPSLLLYLLKFYLEFRLFVDCRTCPPA